jgi:hypothetical protein
MMAGVSPVIIFAGDTPQFELWRCIQYPRPHAGDPAAASIVSRLAGVSSVVATAEVI